MARIIPFNRGGLVGLETIGAVVTDGTLTYQFEAHPFARTPFNGKLLIHFNTPSPSGITGDMPVYFDTPGLPGYRKPVKKAGGVPLTASDITIPCYIEFFYDDSIGVVEAIKGVN